MERLLDMTAALCAGAAVTTGILLLRGFVMRMREELQKNPASEEGGADSALNRKVPPVMRLLLFLGAVWRRPAGAPGLAAQREIIDRRIGMAGYTGSFDAAEYLAARVSAFLLGFFLILLFGLKGMLPVGLIAGLLLMFYPGLWLSGAVKARHLEILKALPNVLDLLTLSVEAGKDFLSSLSDILARRKLDALGEELERALREIQLGKKRSEALRELADRAGQEDLSAVMGAIIQADELGVSIGQLLKIQSDSMRSKRFNRAEKQANEAPVKMLAPLFLFVFPAVIVILAVALGSQLMGIF